MRSVWMAAPAMIAALLLGGCAGGNGVPSGGTPAGQRPGPAAAASIPGPDASASVRSLGQQCTWQGGVTVTVVAVRRNDANVGAAGRAGYSVDVRVVNKTPRGYAGAALTVGLTVGPDDHPAIADYRTGLGTGLTDTIATPGNTVTGSYGFQLPLAEASNQVAVGIRPSPVDQQCLWRGTAQPAAAP